MKACILTGARSWSPAFSRSSSEASVRDSSETWKPCVALRSPAQPCRSLMTTRKPRPTYLAVCDFAGLST